MKKLLILPTLLLILAISGCGNQTPTPTTYPDANTFTSKVTTANFQYPPTLEPIAYELDALEYYGFFKKLDESTLNGVSLASFLVYDWTFTKFKDHWVDDSSYHITNTSNLEKNGHTWQIIEKKRNEDSITDPSPLIRATVLDTGSNLYVFVTTYYADNTSEAKFNDTTRTAEDMFLNSFEL